MHWLPQETRWRNRLLSAVLPGIRPTHGFFDRFQTSAPPILRVGFRLSLLALWASPPIAMGRWTVASRLDAEELDILVLSARTSHWYLLRQCATVVQLVACFAEWEEP